MHSRHNSFLIEQISTNTKTSLSKSRNRKWSGCSTWLSRARSTRWCSLLIGNFSETPEDNSTAVRKSVGSAPEMASATAKCWLRFQLTRGNAPRLAIDKSRLRASRFPRILENASSAGSTMLASAPRVSFIRPTPANLLRKRKSRLRKGWRFGARLNRDCAQRESIILPRDTASGGTSLRRRFRGVRRRTHGWQLLTKVLRRHPSRHAHDANGSC